jgi:hypothetical protein
MKQVFEHIKQRSAEFDRRPLFSYLRDTSIPAEERLRFVPCVAHFVMTFADLYHFFLTENPPKDRYQELVNTHLSEEGSHWKWFLADLANLGLDKQMRFTDVLRFIWSDSTIETRRLAYETCKLSAGMNSLQKLVMVQAIEATGRVGLEAAVPAGNAAAESMKRSLVYFGGHHLDTERQHTIEETDVQTSLENIQVTEEELADLRSIVDRVFQNFTRFVDEAFTVAKTRKNPLDVAPLAELAS